MQQLTEMTIKDFSNLLASDAPAPGGGSTAALAGALGAALTAMVAGLTVGKEKFQEQKPLMEDTIRQCNTIQAQLVDLIDRDTEAFNGVSAVFTMPRNTDEEKQARKDAMQSALKACTKTPYEMMECAAKTLELTTKVLPKYNDSAASDLGVSALSLKLAIQGAWLNVLINLGGIRDEEFVKTYRTGGEAILEKALPMADHVYETVLATVQ